MRDRIAAFLILLAVLGSLWLSVSLRRQAAGQNLCTIDSRFSNIDYCKHPASPGER